MSALRLILLLAGLVVLVAITAWEMRRSRQAHRKATAGSERGEPELGRMPEEFPSHPRSTGDGPGSGRTRTLVPPLVQMSPEATPLWAAPQDDAPAFEPPPRYEPESEREAEPEPEAELMFSGAQSAALPTLDPDAFAEAAFSDPSTAATASAAPLTPQDQVPAEAAEPAEPLEEGICTPDTAPETATPSLTADSCDDASGSPVVDWPPETQRHIIAVRIMSGSEQRLSGRATRQALAACGFVHGRYRIFHQPGDDGRALLSCASLSQPGNFDPVSMDFQRFAGLSLFTILPGPLPPAAALNRLLETAADLTQRLQARLQDEQGRPLDAARVQALRSSVLGLRIGTDAEPAA